MKNMKSKMQNINCINAPIANRRQRASAAQKRANGETAAVIPAKAGIPCKINRRLLCSARNDALPKQT
jgi:hypothetical protein